MAHESCTFQVLSRTWMQMNTVVGSQAHTWSCVLEVTLHPHTVFQPVATWIWLLVHTKVYFAFEQFFNSLFALKSCSGLNISPVQIAKHIAFAFQIVLIYLICL